MDGPSTSVFRRVRAKGSLWLELKVRSLFLGYSSIEEYIADRFPSLSSTVGTECYVRYLLLFSVRPRETRLARIET